MTTIANLSGVEGPNLVLRLIEPDDAEYVHTLRTNPALNRYMSPVNGTVADQKRWIEGYKAREAAKSELYYVIARRDGQRCGLVRLYDITAGCFTWGSWVLDQNKTPKAAVESALLSFDVGFERLGLPTAKVDLLIGNQKAHAFYLRFGMTEVGRNDQEIHLTYSRNRFLADRPDYLSLLHREMRS